MNDCQVMAAITRALAPADSETQKEWTCISFEIEASELERHDDRRGAWEIRPSNVMASKLSVKWQFLEKMPTSWRRDCENFFWRPFITKIAYYLDPETSEKINKELSKC